VNQPEKKEKKLKIYTIISILISLIVIVVILYFTVNTQTIYYLSHVQIRYEYFLIAILLNIFSWILWGLRLQVLSNALDNKLHIGLWESTKIVIANLFLANITPALSGGEPLRIYLLKKDGMSLGSATAAILGERLIDAICVLICVPFALFIFKDYLHNTTLTIGLSVGILLFVIFLLAFFYALKNPEKVKAFLLFLNKKISHLFKKKDSQEPKIVNFIEKEVDNFHVSMLFFIGKGKKTFVVVSILTVAFWGVSFLIASMLLLGLGLPPFFIESYAAQMLLLVIVTMPTTPGSSGIAEISISGLYGVLLGSSYGYLLGVFVLLFRFITYHMNLIAGAIFQYRIFKSLTSFSLNALIKEKE
jgi:glycosyltransferase 2 family protein